MEQIKKRAFSGIKPSGTLNIGHYLGAIRNWINYIEEYEAIFCVVDLHAITVRQDPAELRKRTLEQLAQYIACGLDPDKCLLFIQSHVAEHTQLSWVLGCYTMFGELSRMTQFKEKSEQNSENINAGLFTYPVLMAADILLYDADIVPVGEDQKQHVEITRDIAQRFNHVYGDTFKLPEPYIPKVGARIKSLTDPDGKMSKSADDPNGSVFLMDKPEVIMKKFSRAVTDSEAEVAYREHKAGINNLMTIYSCATGKSFGEIENEFAGKGYGDFKKSVGEAAVELLRPIREKTEELLRNKDYLESVYKAGAEKAENIARRKIQKVYRKLGFTAK